MKAKSFKRAVELLKKLDFEEYEVNEEISYISCVDNKIVYQNWFIIYLDDDNGTFAVELRENGKYYLTYDDDLICLIDGEMAQKIDAFRDAELEKNEEDNLAYQYERKCDYADMVRKSNRENQIFGL